MKEVSAMKKITVKFGNLKCAGCGREVKVGESAWYHNSPHIKLTFCTDCAGEEVGQAVRSWMLAQLAASAILIAEAASLLEEARQQGRIISSVLLSRLEREAELVETTTERIHQLSARELVENLDTFARNLLRLDAAEEVGRWYQSVMGAPRRHGD
jgi:hypothetical protein